MTIKEIQDAIQEWETQKNNEIALEYLTSGFGFEFLKSEYETWNKESDSNDYYVYLGIYQKQLVFFVSSQLAEDICNANQVIIAEFHRSVNTSKIFPSSKILLPPVYINSLGKSEAMTRVTDWLLCCNYWYDYYKENGFGLVSYFMVPKADMDNIFDKNKGNAFRIICLLALNFQNVPQTTITNYIELIFIGENQVGNTGINSPNKPEFTVYEDITKPRPPF